MRRLPVLMAALLATLTPCTALGSSVRAVIVADGNYALFCGTADGSQLELLAIHSGPSGDGTMRPQPLSFDIDDDRYIYIVAWGQPPATCGLLAEFLFNGLAVMSGDPAWEVYATAPDVAAGGVPGISAVSEQIRRANHRFLWLKAARTRLNTPDMPWSIPDISNNAAWMWLPTDSGPFADPPAPSVAAGACVVFRIAPNKLWPEIELWHTRNAGRTDILGGARDAGPRYWPMGGGGPGTAGSSGVPGLGHGLAPAVQNPFEDYAPPGSSTSPATSAAQEPVPPTLPPAANKEAPEPLGQHAALGKPAPQDNPPQPPPPPVPEPASLAMLLASVGLRRWR